MKKHVLILPVFLVAVVALILGAAVPRVQAQPEPPVCWFNIELNGSEIDVGVRGFFDNEEPYKELKITDPDVIEIEYDVMKQSMALQGKAEFFFESGEPVIGEDGFTLATFFDRFPSGYYHFHATTIDGDPVHCYEYFSHVMPCAAETSAAGNRGLGVTISWDPVTEVVDAEATDANGGEELVCEDGALTIVGYEVIVEIDDSGQIFDINLPADATSVTVPPEFIALSDEFKYEVLAIEASGNQTTIEQWFCINERNGHVVECEENGD